MNPLSGVRVLDFSKVLGCAPICGHGQTGVWRDHRAYAMLVHMEIGDMEVNIIAGVNWHKNPMCVEVSARVRNAVRESCRLWYRGTSLAKDGMSIPTWSSRSYS